MASMGIAEGVPPPDLSFFVKRLPRSGRREGCVRSGKRTPGKDSVTIIAAEMGIGEVVPEDPALTMRDSPVTP